MGTADDTAESVALLRGAPLLAGLDDALMQRLAAEVEVVELAPGEWLFRQGDDADTAYVLAAGRLDVVVESPTPTTIRTLRRGATFGELAVLTGGTRTASIRARRDARVLALRSDHFDDLLDNAKGFAQALARTLGAELGEVVPSAAPVQEPPRIVAVVALDEGIHIGPAASALAQELRLHGSVNAPAPTATDWAAELSRAEADCDRVLLVAADPDPDDGWTAFCLREADAVVALTTGAPDARWTDRSASLLDCELIVVGARGSDALHDRLGPRTTRTVGSTDAIDRVMTELGRRFAGRAVGVVLSGGGARAFSHLGVVEELRRAGVRIDRVGGVSLGALVAGAIATGRTDAEIYGLFEQGFLTQNPSSDYTLPVVSLIRGQRTKRLLRETFGDVRIEELPIPFFCASADIVRRELVVHREGLLADAILASLSIPGVFPPIVDRAGRLLVDGGVIDNLPVSEMARNGEGPVIAVDVTGIAAASRTTRRGGALGGVVGAARSRITGTRETLPRLPETIVRCMTLASSDTIAAGRDHADLVVTPDVSGVGMLDWSKLPQMRQAGVDAARHALAAHDAVADAADLRS